MFIGIYNKEIIGMFNKAVKKYFNITAPFKKV